MRDRRQRFRCIGVDPTHKCFKPCGVHGRGLETVELRADEFEALRLMDFEGLYQEECARHMGISRTTFSRIVAEAHRKVAEALLNGKRLLIATAEQPAATTEVDPQAASFSGPAPAIEQNEWAGRRRAAWRRRDRRDRTVDSFKESMHEENRHNRQR